MNERRSRPMTAAPPRRASRSGALLAAGVAVALAATAAWCQAERHGAPATPATPVPPAAVVAAAPLLLRHRLIAVHPHDPASYTQGLLWDDGVLLESTGRYGTSKLREIELETGTPRREVALDPGLFGEGLARVGDRLVQLTWREGIAIVWSRPDFRELSRVAYKGEGWGLAWDGTDLWMSSGSSVLVRRDPTTLAERGRLRVTLGDLPLPNLNELEFVDGRLWANVYTTDRLVRIDPSSGRVDAMLDLAGLLEPAERRTAEVLNGIAWRPVLGEPGGGRLLVTGKYWPKLFELAIETPPG